jgi:hypothetical protein
MKKNVDPKATKRNFTFKNWFTIIGSVIIFSSWMAERQVDLHKSKVDDLKRSQLVIDITEVNRSNLEIEYNKAIRSNPIDSPQVAFIEINLALTYMNLINYNRMRIAGVDSEKIKLAQNDILQKDFIDSTNRKAFIMRKFAYIDSSFVFVRNKFGQKYIALDRQYPVIYRVEDSSQQFWSNIFSWSYGVGSVFIALAYFSGIIRKNKEEG